MSDEGDALPSLEVGSLLAALSGLEKQIGRVGREQLKANALSEAQGQRLNDLLTAVQAAEARRDRDVTALREESSRRETAARQALLRTLLPVIDGLDQALQAGGTVLRRAPVAVPTWWERFTGRAPVAADDQLREAMAAWLTGLEFVQQRLLVLLKNEGIQPMQAAGASFDPQLHVALEVVNADAAHPSGSVVSEIRRGYLLDDRVFRLAEVAVAR